MGMIYLVRKKLFQTKEGAKQLYYAVQRTLQPRGGVTEDILAKRIAHRTGRSEGDVKGILAEQVLPGKYVEQESCGSGKEGGTARRISGRRDY